MKKTTHPIQSTVNNTTDAVNTFDAISYEKGASFIKQMSHFVGRDILTDGMNEYFTKFALKNTQLPDFITCLQNAAVKNGKDMDIQSWTDSWLTKAGANEIKAHFDKVDASGNGTITIEQFYPCVGDKVYHSQVIQIKFFGSNHESHIQKFNLLA